MPSANRLTELVGEAYGFDGLEEFRSGILEVLNRAVPSIWVSYNEVGSDPERTFALSLPPGPPEAMVAFARHAHENPLIVEYMRTGDGRPRRISDVMSSDRFHELAIYRECYRPLGVESQVALTLPARPPLLLGLALSRGAEDYSDAEMELLGLARPHLIQAYRNAELATAREATIAALERGLESLSRHIVVLDAHGRVEFATDSARELLGHPGGGRNAMPAGVREWLADARVRRGAAEPLVLQADSTTALLRLLPGASGDTRDVLVLEGGTGELSVAALRDLGLTERESQALRWVALGRSAEQAADEMGVARRTLDKHLQNVYAKLGVSSVAQAAATAWAAVGIGFDAWPF